MLDATHIPRALWLRALSAVDPSVPLFFQLSFDAPLLVPWFFLAPFSLLRYTLDGPWAGWGDALLMIFLISLDKNFFSFFGLAVWFAGS